MHVSCFKYAACLLGLLMFQIIVACIGLAKAETVDLGAAMQKQWKTRETKPKIWDKIQKSVRIVFNVCFSMLLN